MHYSFVIIVKERNNLVKNICSQLSENVIACVFPYGMFCRRKSLRTKSRTSGVYNPLNAQLVHLVDCM